MRVLSKIMLATAACAIAAPAVASAQSRTYGDGPRRAETFDDRGGAYGDASPAQRAYDLRADLSAAREAYRRASFAGRLRWGDAHRINRQLTWMQARIFGSGGRLSGEDALRLSERLDDLRRELASGD